MTRVQIQIEGGIAHFPGLSQPSSIDVSALSSIDQARFEQLVAEARFFEQPKIPSGARGADLRQYTITIASGSHKNTVRICDPISDPKLESLVRFLLEHRDGPASKSGATPSKQRKRQ